MNMPNSGDLPRRKRGRSVRWSPADIEELGKYLVSAGLTVKSRSLASEIRKAQQIVLPAARHRPDSSLQSSSVLNIIRGAILQAQKNGVPDGIPAAKVATEPRTFSSSSPGKPEEKAAPRSGDIAREAPSSIAEDLEETLGRIGASIGKIIASAIMSSIKQHLSDEVGRTVAQIEAKLPERPPVAGYQVGRVHRVVSPKHQAREEASSLFNLGRDTQRP